MFKPLQNCEQFKWVFPVVVFQCSFGLQSHVVKGNTSYILTNNILSSPNDFIKGTSYKTFADAANEYTLSPNDHTAENKVAAMNGNPESSAQFFLLNGIRKFNAIRKPADQADRICFYAADFDYTNRDYITGHSNREAESDNDLGYSDEKYFFDTKPDVLNYNQRGTSKRQGYPEDSKTASKFAGTKYIRAGPGSARPVFFQNRGNRQAEQGMLKLPETKRSIGLLSTHEYIFDYCSKTPDHHGKTGRLILPTQIRNCIKNRNFFSG